MTSQQEPGRHRQSDPDTPRQNKIRPPAPPGHARHRAPRPTRRWNRRPLALIPLALTLLAAVTVGIGLQPVPPPETATAAAEPSTRVTDGSERTMADRAQRGSGRDPADRDRHDTGRDRRDRSDRWDRAQRGRGTAETTQPAPPASESAPAPASPPATTAPPPPPPPPCDTTVPGEAACAQIPGLAAGAWIRPTHGPVTSEFGTRWGRLHAGIDIAPEQNTPVYAASDGSVTDARCAAPDCSRPGYLGMGGYGNLVEITHPDGVVTRYAHLLRYVVSDGAQVRAGQLIGFVGSTGNSTGPHLHFETRVGGEPVNPADFMASRGVDLYADSVG